MCGKQRRKDRKVYRPFSNDEQLCALVPSWLFPATKTPSHQGVQSNNILSKLYPHNIHISCNIQRLPIISQSAVRSGLCDFYLAE